MKKSPVSSIGSCVGKDRLEAVPGLDNSNQNDAAGQADK
jgi:hypothetical protein